jgi:hypothetical protein
LPVKSHKNGIWSQWRPGHASRSADWQQRTPEKPKQRRNRQLDASEYDSITPAGALSSEELQLVLWDGMP